MFIDTKDPTIITARKRFAKVKFLHVSVSHSVHRGEVVSQHALQVVPQHALQVSRGGVSQHALQVSRPTPRGSLRGLAWGDLQAHTWGGVSRPTPREVSRPTPGGCIPACTEADTLSADGYCCRWYASYWNAFLFHRHLSVCGSGSYWADTP